MATHTFPSSYNESYFRYNIDGGDWLAPSRNTLTNIYAGRTNGGQIYRAYIYIPGQKSLNTTGINISNITLNLPIGSEYSSDGRWDIGIMANAPNKTVSYNTSGFIRIASDKVAAENTTLTISVPVSTWGDPTVGKYIVIVASEARGSSYSYKGVECSSNRHPTLVYTYAYKTYTVSYNANGGSDAPKSQTKTYNVTLTLSNTKPTRTGYSFQGWATSPDGGVTYASGASYTNNASVTLYAVWKSDACIYIGNGTSFDRYEVYIGNGTSWEKYMPYVGDGESWNSCG